MRISVVNYDPNVSIERLNEVIRAINIQIERDFEPYWHMGARLRLDSADPAVGISELSGLRGDAVIYIVDKPEARYLGLHQRHANGTPFGFVYTSLAGENWSIPLSHEALELLADPNCNLYCKGPHPNPAEDGREVFHWLEVCDPVQGEHYTIDGVEVSNFVLPLYFTGGEEMEGRNDFLGTVTEAGRLRSFSANPGGYVGFHDPTAQSEARGDEQWFPDEVAKEVWKGKCDTIPGPFRRAMRRARLHPLQLSASDLAGGDRVAVASIYLRIRESELLDRAVCRLSAALDSEDFSLTPSSFDRRDIRVDGPALARPIGELWDRLQTLVASGEDWLEDADILLADGPGHEDEDSDVRAAGFRNKVCLCDARDHHPDSGPQDWALAKAGIVGAWRLLEKSRPGEQPGAGVLIGHPDTGYTSYLKKNGRVAPGGFDFLRNQADAVDPLVPGTPGHGTRTGSVLVGPRGKPGEFSGVAPGARLVPFRIATTPLLGSGWNLAEALRKAVERKVDVVSMSVGTGIDDKRLRKAIEFAYESNLVLVAAAGNCVDWARQHGYVVNPARNARCIACAATDARGQLWCGTSNAVEVDVYAPGDSVWCHSVSRNGEEGLIRRRGTSFATAMVAGTAALWIHHHGRDRLRQLCTPQIKMVDLFLAVLTKTGKPTAFHPSHAGLLDAEAVLECDLDTIVNGAMKAKLAPGRALERLARLFPELHSEEFGARLAEALGRPSADIDVLARDHERELEVMLIRDDGLRGAIHREQDTTGRAAKPSAGERGQLMSTALRGLVGEPAY